MTCANVVKFPEGKRKKTGVLTAWFLKRRGREVIVLEANTIGNGQTGNKSLIKVQVKADKEEYYS